MFASTTINEYSDNKVLKPNTHLKLTKMKTISRDSNEGPSKAEITLKSLLEHLPPRPDDAKPDCGTNAHDVEHQITLTPVYQPVRS